MAAYQCPSCGWENGMAMSLRCRRCGFGREQSFRGPIYYQAWAPGWSPRLEFWHRPSIGFVLAAIAIGLVVFVMCAG